VRYGTRTGHKQVTLVNQNRKKKIGDPRGKRRNGSRSRKGQRTEGTGKCIIVGIDRDSRSPNIQRGQIPKPPGLPPPGAQGQKKESHQTSRKPPWREVWSQEGLRSKRAGGAKRSQRSTRRKKPPHIEMRHQKKNPDRTRPMSQRQSGLKKLPD